MHSESEHMPPYFPTPGRAEVILGTTWAEKRFRPVKKYYLGWHHMVYAKSESGLLGQTITPS
jgi:hypothetical protein